MDQFEKRIIDLIEEHRDQIIAFARDIYTHAELGYREFRTSEKFVEWMRRFSLPMETELAVTGARVALNEDRKEDFSLALLGEMDALAVPEHKFVNPDTMASHCCGHHAQLAAVAGAAIALCDPEIKEKLDGQVVFMAVPAEEYVDLEYRKNLISQGKIKYLGGKCELLCEGAFDDVDMSLTHHLDHNTPFIGNGSANGFVTKIIHYYGAPSHAAVAPENGINALAAANIGLHALGMNRETFRDQDHVRVHPILTKGGNIVNVVPSEAVIETLVRASTPEAMEDACMKTDRSFVAGAMAMGAKVVIENMPGYMPGIPMPVNPELKEALAMAEPGKTVNEKPVTNHDCGSSDLGDLQHIMPVINFRTGGVVGGMHEAVFDVVDEDAAYIAPAKAFALMAYRLMKDGATLGKEICKGYQARFASKEEYVAYLESQSATVVYDYTTVKQ